MQLDYFELSIFARAQRTRHAENVLRRLQLAGAEAGAEPCTAAAAATAGAAAASAFGQGHDSCTCPTLRHKQLLRIALSLSLSLATLRPCNILL